MKKVLIVLAVLGGLGVIAIGVGGYWLYKKSNVMMAEMVKMADKEVNEFIEKKNPPQPVIDSLNRLMKAVKLKESWSNAMMVTAALNSIQDGTVDDQEKAMLDDASDLLEEDDLTNEKVQAFVEKYQNVIAKAKKKK